MSRSATVISTRPAVGSRCPAASCALKKARPKECARPSTSPVERISGPSTGSTSGNMLNGKTASLTPKCGIERVLRPSSPSFLPEHDLGGELGHRDVADLRDQRDGPRAARVGLEDVDDIPGDRVLDVHQADDVQRDGDLARVVADGLQVQRRDADRGDDAGGVPGVDARQLDVLHDRGDEGVGAVGDGVGLGLDGVLEELVDQDRALRRHVDRREDVVPQHLLVEDDLPSRARRARRRGAASAGSRSARPPRRPPPGSPPSPTRAAGSRARA